MDAGFSVFGSILNREAGFLPIRPLQHQLPHSTRGYEPGTNVLETTWKTPTGWVLVRDARYHGARAPRMTASPRTPAHPPMRMRNTLLVRTVECIAGRVEMEPVCEPAFDYGRTPAQWQYSVDAAMPSRRTSAEG